MEAAPAEDDASGDEGQLDLSALGLEAMAAPAASPQANLLSSLGGGGDDENSEKTLLSKLLGSF